MLTDKELKKQFKVTANQHPEKYYAVTVLKENGFKRKHCKCGTYFWTTTDRIVCGDPACAGGFQFFKDKPARNTLDYIGVWKAFSALMQKQGYTPINRYPVIARWRKDTDFVQASIYDFQPYVVSGEVKPPANPLVVPQFCLRFNDIDNVGITGAHYTGFVMIGQHAFTKQKEFKQEKYFRDIFLWLTEGLGLPANEITFHEDVWAGGGNLGPCMEFFSRGLELGNQVYMQFEKTETGLKELNLKVLDMGMGHERNAWFSQGKSTSYETTFPTVCKYLFKKTGIIVDEKVLQKFLPYSSYLNVDEVEDINKTWQEVAKKIDVDVHELKEKVQPLAALFSVAEHSRSLLFALADGGLPSNVGGGYNLRVILRRALAFIEHYGWDVNLSELCTLHADYLHEIFPELKENLDGVKKILEVEQKKYAATKQKSVSIVKNIVQKEVTPEKLIELYDSQGIAPELIKEQAALLGKKIVVPDNFYAQVAALHQEKEQEHATEKETRLPLENINETKALYFEDYKKIKAEVKVLAVLGQHIILDQTVFYPTSGGQLHDTGYLVDHKKNKEEVVDVFKQGNIIVHKLKHDAPWKIGDVLICEVDKDRREQLAQHHTATHIINAAARRVLGRHINQAGAKKTPEKAHIDITHYEALTDEELKKIEAEANKIVAEDVEMHLSFMDRDVAEQQFGMAIYQGGAVPGKSLRIVNIPEVDVEACGGTHLQRTSEIKHVKLLKSTKIQDGVVRIIFVAGKAASSAKEETGNFIEQLAKELHCAEAQVPYRAEELFVLWKNIIKKKKDMPRKLISTAAVEGDLLAKTCELIKTQPEHVLKTIQRFKKELGI